MSTNSPIGGPGKDPSLRPISPTDGGDEAKRGQRGGGPAFEALLEKLQQKARSLSADSESVANPEDLGGAVDAARSTLDDALSLSDQLLEAFRQAEQDGKEDTGGKDDAGGVERP